MIAWLVVGYVVIGILSLVPLQRKLLDLVVGDLERETFDMYFSAVLALIAAVMWPLFVIGALALFASRAAWSFFEQPKVHQ